MEKDYKYTLASEILHHLVVQNRRIFVAFIIVLVMFFASNLTWICLFNQYDFQSYELNSKDGGNANFIGNDGDITNGNSESKAKNKEESSSKRNGDTKAEEKVNGNQ